MSGLDETNLTENNFTPDELIRKQPEFLYFQQQRGIPSVNTGEAVKQKTLSKTSAVIILLIITALYTLTMMLSVAVAKRSGLEPNNINRNYPEYFYTQEA